MKRVSSANNTVDFDPADELERLELKIAKRADDLSKQNAFEPHDAVEFWCRAEREILGAVGLPPPA